MNETDLLDWIRARIAVQSQQSIDAISPDANVTSVGLDSVGLVGLSGDLEEKLGRRINPEWMYEHETLRELAAFLAQL